MKVLVTRAEPAASQTARKLEAQGFSPLVAPLFEIVDTGNEIPAGPFDGAIFTSRNAVSVLEARGWKPDPAMGVAYCVGKKTQAAAKRLGFADAVFADGGGRALAELISHNCQSARARLLYPAPRDRAFDMVAALNGTHVQVELVEVYMHKKRQLPIPELETCKDMLSDCVVMAYSEKSARYAADVLFSMFRETSTFTPRLVAISENTANSVLKYPWHGVYVADRPNEMEMIEKIRELTLRKGSEDHIV